MMFKNELIENIGDSHRNSLVHILNTEGTDTTRSVVNHSHYINDVTFVSQLRNKKK